MLSFSYSQSARRGLSSPFGRLILRHLNVFWGLSLIILCAVVAISSWRTVELSSDWTPCELADPVSDVTGVGIRVATYLQTLLTIFVEFYSAKQAGVVLQMNLAFLWTLAILYRFAEGNSSAGITVDIGYIILCLGNCIFLVTLSRIIFPIHDEGDNQETLLTRFLRFVTYILWGTCHIHYWYKAVPVNFSELTVTISMNDELMEVSQDEARSMGICIQELRGWFFVPWTLDRRPSNPVYLANSIAFAFCVGVFCLMSFRLFRMVWLVLRFVLKSSAFAIPTGTGEPKTDADTPEPLNQFCLQKMRRARLPSRCRILLDAWLRFPTGDLKWIFGPVSSSRPQARCDINSSKVRRALICASAWCHPLSVLRLILSRCIVLTVNHPVGFQSRAKSKMEVVP